MPSFALMSLLKCVDETSIYAICQKDSNFIWLIWVIIYKCNCFPSCAKYSFFSSTWQCRCINPASHFPLFALPALVCAVVCLIQTVYLKFCQSFIFEATIFFLQSCYSNQYFSWRGKIQFPLGPLSKPLFEEASREML